MFTEGQILKCIDIYPDMEPYFTIGNTYIVSMYAGTFDTVPIVIGDDSRYAVAVNSPDIKTYFKLDNDKLNLKYLFSQA